MGGIDMAKIINLPIQNIKDIYYKLNDNSFYRPGDSGLVTGLKWVRGHKTYAPCIEVQFDDGEIEYFNIREMKF